MVAASPPSFQPPNAHDHHGPRELRADAVLDVGHPHSLYVGGVPVIPQATRSRRGRPIPDPSAPGRPDAGAPERGACPRRRLVARCPARTQGSTTITARSTFGRRLRRLAFIELALLSTLLVPSALAETATATLSASASIVNFGKAVTVSGSIAADPGASAAGTSPCSGSRPTPPGSRTSRPGRRRRTARSRSCRRSRTPGATARRSTRIRRVCASTTNQVLVRVRGAGGRRAGRRLDAARARASTSRCPSRRSGPARSSSCSAGRGTAGG